eukprot:1480604-Pleurochrysis_carterae.AAC.1
MVQDLRRHLIAQQALMSNYHAPAICYKASQMQLAVAADTDYGRTSDKCIMMIYESCLLLRKASYPHTSAHIVGISGSETFI